MTQEERAKQKNLFLQFQNDWNLDRVRNMTLEEYTGIMSEGERKDFTYILEYGDLKEWGSVKGGAGGLNNLKSWICRCSGNEKGFNREVLYSNDRKYAWLKEYYDKDNNPNEAFKEIKNRIIKIIQASQRNDLDSIEKVKLEGMVKWKIAFHYQNPNDMKMFCIFKKEVLERIAKNELGNENLPISQIYMQLMKDKTYTLEDSVNEFSQPFWKKYEKENKANQETSNDKGESTMPDELNKIPLNQILYGPPGTGKTYSTIDKALEILGYAKSNDNGKVMLDYTKIKQKLQDIADNKKDMELDLENLNSKNDRELAKLLFDYYRSTEKGQIKFITFHQSFSYEEFVEGIKPVFVDENGDEVENSKNMIYKVKDGIFKELCDKAKRNANDKPYTIDTTKTLWRLYTIPDANTNNDYFDECMKNNYVRVLYNYGGVKLKDDVKEGDYIAIPSTSYGEMSKTIRAFGVLKGIKDEYEGKNDEYVREVEWLWSVKDENEILRFDKEINFNRPTFQRVKTGKEKILEFMQKLLAKKDFETKPYILIIDEINRGNISKILGELITLIEESKRIGKDEELKVRLPYSTDEFGVPSNLYIIGTMNTADRSIALLDTALRRRFEFVEMMPKPELLKDIWLVRDINKAEETSLDKWEDDDAEILFNILTAINNRIEFLLDREHTIGHSFFFEKAKFVKNGEIWWYELSLADLKEIFAKKIIPLLQEYFYEDYAKIDAVLNGNKMVEKVSKSVTSLFQKSRPDDLEDKTIYNITPLHSGIWDNPQSYKNIYDSKVENSQDSNESNENGE